MKDPSLIMIVRLKSPLTLDEVNAIAQERAPEFRAVGGLLQKYYLHDPSTGDYIGMYLWDSEEYLEAFRKSDLRSSIAKAYQVQGEPQIDVLRVFKTLRSAETGTSAAGSPR